MAKLTAPKRSKYAGGNIAAPACNPSSAAHTQARTRACACEFLECMMSVGCAPLEPFLGWCASPDALKRVSNAISQNRLKPDQREKVRQFVNFTSAGYVPSLHA